MASNQIPLTFDISDQTPEFTVPLPKVGILSRIHRVKLTLPIGFGLAVGPCLGIAKYLLHLSLGVFTALFCCAVLVALLVVIDRQLERVNALELLRHNEAALRSFREHELVKSQVQNSFDLATKAARGGDSVNFNLVAGLVSTGTSSLDLPKAVRLLQSLGYEVHQPTHGSKQRDASVPKKPSGNTPTDVHRESKSPNKTVRFP